MLLKVKITIKKQIKFKITSRQYLHQIQIRPNINRPKYHSDDHQQSNHINQTHTEALLSQKDQYPLADSSNQSTPNNIKMTKTKIKSSRSYL